MPPASVGAVSPLLAPVLILFSNGRVSDFNPWLLMRALHNAFRLVRGLRKQVTDVDESIMTKEILKDLDTSGWEITRIPGRYAGFVIPPDSEKQYETSSGFPDLSSWSDWRQRNWLCDCRSFR